MNKIDIEKELKLLRDENASLKKERTELIKIRDAHNAFLNNSKDYIYFKDKQHRFISVNHAFLELTGYESREDVIGKTDFELFDKEHAEIYFKEQKRILEDGEMISGVEEPFYDFDGNLGWVSTSKWPIYNKDNEIVGLIGMSRNITHVKKIEKSLQRKACFDHLTNLYNREFFLKKSEELLESLDLDKEEVFASLFFIDLDDFKKTNDTFGHDAGDFVLNTVATRLTGVLRSSDIIGRVGGDEFVVLAVLENKNDYESIANKMLKQVLLPIEWHDQTLNIGCSIGVSCFPTQGETLSTLLKKADMAMYKAKSSGKNSYCLYSLSE